MIKEGSFLGEVAQAVLERHAGHFGDLYFIFPNTLTLEAFKKELITEAKKRKQTCWLPLYSFDDFVSLHTGYTLVDGFSLSTRLYETYCSLTAREKMQGGGRFLSWHQIVLSDFDLLDKERVDPERFFGDMVRHKHNRYGDFQQWQSAYYRQVIQFFWDENEEEHEKRATQLWRLLHPLYKAYRARLHDEGCAYRGMAYRALAEKLARGYLFEKKIVFIGFHAFNQAELFIVRACTERGGGWLYWDADDFYMRQEHRAGDILRRYRKDKVLAATFPVSIPSHYEKAKEIVCVEAPSIYAQAKAIGVFLSQHSQQENPPRVGIILSQREALHPLIDALPVNSTSLRLSFHYDPTHLQLPELMKCLLVLWHAYEKENGYPRHLLERLWLHGVYGLLHEEHARYWDALARSGSSPSWWVHADAVKDLRDTYHFLFARAGDSLAARLIHSLTMLQQRAETVPTFFSNPFEAPFLREVLKRLKAQEVLLAFLFQTDDFQQIEQALAQVTTPLIPFRGDPEAHVHILTLESSRNLDFHTVIFPGANEGALPPPYRKHTLIPYKLRNLYELPDYHMHNTLSTYFFHRLIQRASCLRFYHGPTETGGGEKNELSRFVQQLKYASPHAASVQESKIVYPIASIEPTPVKVRKDPALMQEIADYLAKEGLSFSAFRSYLDCPLQFYFKYILKLKPQKTPMKVEDPAQKIGVLLHETMEALYRPYEGKEITTTAPLIDAWHQMRKSEDFGKKLRSYQSIKGVYISLLCHIVEEIMKKDTDTPFTLHALEETLAHTLQVRGMSVCFRGKIDRIDVWRGVHRIVDYKTGKIPKSKRIGDFSKFSKKSENRSFVQLLFYAWLFEKARKEAGTLTARLLTVRGAIDIENDGGEPLNTKEYTPDVEEKLRHTAEELLDENTPFARTDNTAPCARCPYHSLCHR